MCSVFGGQGDKREGGKVGDPGKGRGVKCGFPQKDLFSKWTALALFFVEDLIQTIFLQQANCLLLSCVSFHFGAKGYLLSLWQKAKDPGASF